MRQVLFLRWTSKPTVFRANDFVNCSFVKNFYVATSNILYYLPLYDVCCRYCNGEISVRACYVILFAEKVKGAVHRKKAWVHEPILVDKYLHLSSSGLCEFDLFDGDMKGQ